jgi:4-hydroxybenzoate polyprenyltransferase
MGRGEFSIARMLACGAASLCLYAAGLIANDCFDLEDDRRERPKRPLPSGAIPPSFAGLVGFLLGALGIALAALASVMSAGIAVGLVVMVLVYDAGGKRVSGWGPLNMGLCRGLSLLLGAAAAGPKALSQPLPLLAALGVTVYIAVVTWIASDETRVDVPRRRFYVPPFVLLVFYLAVTIGGAVLGARGIVASVLMLFAMLSVLFASRSVLTQPGPGAVPQCIGRYIRALVFIQASLCMLGGLEMIPLVLALHVAWMGSGLLGRVFYAS